MGASNVRAGGAFIELYANSTKLLKDLGKASKTVKEWGTSLSGIGTKIFAAGAAIKTALSAAGAVFAENAASLSRMSVETGASVASLGRMGFAITATGGKAEDLQAAIGGIDSAMMSAASGGQGAIDALAAVGLNWRQLQTMSPEKKLAAVADGLKKIKNSAQKADLAKQLLGGTALLPTLAKGSAGLADMATEAERLGQIMSEEDAAAGRDMQNAFSVMSAVIKQLTVNIGSALAPSMTKLFKQITEGVAIVSKWISDNRKVIVMAAQVATAIMAAGAAIVAVGYIITGIGAGMGMLATVCSAVATVWGGLVAVVGFLVSPLGLVLVAIGAIVAAWLYFSGEGQKAVSAVTEAFSSLKSFVGQVLGGISDALAAGDITLAAEVLWKSLLVVWNKGINWLNEAWVSWRGFFVDVAAAAVNILSKLLLTAWFAIEDGLTEATATMQTAWTLLTGNLQDSFAIVAGGILSSIAQIIDAIKELTGMEFGIDSEGLRQTALALRGAGGATTGKLDKIEDDRKKSRQRTEDIRSGALNSIDDDERRAQNKRDEQRQQELQPGRDRLAASNADMQKAIAAAAEAKRKAEADAAKKLPPGSDPASSPLVRVAQKVASTGTFGTNAGRSLGSVGPIDRVAKATEDTAKSTKQLVTYSKNGGSVFT